MSDNDPYDDRRGRRRRERERDPDPLSDPWPRASGTEPSATDPWTSPGGPSATPDPAPVTGGWEQQARPRAEDVWRAERARAGAVRSDAPPARRPAPHPLDPDPERPRGRRHRADDPAGPGRGSATVTGTDPFAAAGTPDPGRGRHGTGPIETGPDDLDERPHEPGRRRRAAEPGTGPTPPADSAPRGRRHRRAGHDAEESAPWAERDDEPEPDFAPVQPRVLDFDSVPVRRKRPRERDDEPAPRRRRRRDPVEEPDALAGGEEDAPEPGDVPPPRRRRGAALADPPATDTAEDPADDHRRGRRRRSAADGADDPDTAPRRSRRGAAVAAESEADGWHDDEYDSEAEPARGRRRGGRAARPEDERGSRAEAGRRPRRGAVPADVEDEFADEEAAEPESDPGAGAEAGRGRRARGRGARTDDGRAPRAEGGRRSRRAAPEPEDDEDAYDDAESESAAEAPRPRGRGKRGRGARGAEPASRRRGRTAERGKKGVAIVVAVAVVAVAGGGYAGSRYLFPPDFDGEGSGEVEVTVEDGASGAAVAASMEEQGVVASSRAFLNALDGQGAGVTPGTYRLREGMSGAAAVALLLDPASRVGVQVTIQEGLRSTKILEKFAEEAGLPIEDLEAAYADTEALGLPEYADEGPEGYLFPDTYAVSPGDDAAEVLQRMVARFDQAAQSTNLEAAAGERDLTPNEIMSIAAIIQAESGTPEDMPKISRVVYNRIDQGMELGMDSTCFYVIEEYGIALTNDQLDACKAADSGYATYGRTGLPVGPIVSPGEDAIEAALAPADGGWLYFVATDPENGVTEFAETYEEFEVLKAEFEANQQAAS
ncbi:endolytic transglycosylase MltG [Nocardiopsis mangrovi]|uniref:Endolytic murein transglycosylase n=1 Tax=Nocardiopsis mangrovi TaxID=1179818 RepID=A0ABV9DZ57_9ACTN